MLIQLTFRQCGTNQQQQQQLQQKRIINYFPDECKTRICTPRCIYLFRTLKCKAKDKQHRCEFIVKTTKKNHQKHSYRYQKNRNLNRFVVVVVVVQQLTIQQTMFRIFDVAPVRARDFLLIFLYLYKAYAIHIRALFC